MTKYQTYRTWQTCTVLQTPIVEKLIDSGLDDTTIQWVLDRTTPKQQNETTPKNKTEEQTLCTLFKN